VAKVVSPLRGCEWPASIVDIVVGRLL